MQLAIWSQTMVFLIYSFDFWLLTFFAISIPISEVMAVRKLCFVEA